MAEETEGKTRKKAGRMRRVDKRQKLMPGRNE